MMDQNLRSTLRETCELSKRHSFDPVFMKLFQNVCHHVILTKFETGSCRVENLVTRSNLGKKLVYMLEDTGLIQTLCNFVRMLTVKTLYIGTLYVLGHHLF